MTLASEKQTLRAALRARRKALAAAVPDHAALLGGLAPMLDLPDGAVIGGYMALSGEADPTILMAQLAARGYRLAVPRVAGKHAPLSFHAYAPGHELAPGAYGIAEPDPAAPRLDPHVLLVPLLGFDAAGRRLGYGGGYYDRTLEALRAQGPVQAIGIAYAGQEVAVLPTESFDMPLDAVLTEKGIKRFRQMA